MNSIRKYSTYLIISSLIFMLLIYSGFRYLHYESPEDCFVREMTEWAEKKNLLDNVKSLTQAKNSSLAVAKAKTVLKEYSTEDLKDDNEEIYIQTGTLLEYCGVKS